jgi:hypothetical protein
VRALDDLVRQGKISLPGLLQLSGLGAVPGVWIAE